MTLKLSINKLQTCIEEIQKLGKNIIFFIIVGGFAPYFN